MSLMTRIQSAWQALVGPLPSESTGNSSNGNSRKEADALHSLSKGLDTQRGKLLEHQKVLRKGRHLPLQSLTGSQGLAPMKTSGVSFEMLRGFYRNNPWVQAAVRIRSREVAHADWDIVPALQHHERELNHLRQLCGSVLQFPERRELLHGFEHHYLQPQMVRELIEAGSSRGLTEGEMRYRFSLALSDLTRRAEYNAASVRVLFDHPNINGQSWSDLLLAIVPDVLVLASGCLEKRRLLRPETRKGSGVPRANNPVVELHWVDGATVRPCIDEQGLLRGIQNPEEHAYEQYIDGQLVEGSGWRHTDLLRIVENPETDVSFWGYGFSRVEALVATSLLLAMDDQAELEELRREFYGGILNIEDESIDQDDLLSWASWLEDQYIGNKRLPLAAFKKLTYVPTRSTTAGADSGAIERQRQRLLRVCAIFEMSPMKLGHFYSANYSTSQTSQEHGDEGLRNLMSLMERHVNAGIVAGFGFEDVKYVSSAQHNRDMSRRLEEAEHRQSLGIDDVNDTRLSFGKPPIENGDKPAAYFEGYWKKRGEMDAQVGGGHAIPEQPADIADKLAEDETADTTEDEKTPSYNRQEDARTSSRSNHSQTTIVQNAEQGEER
jgi:hypothetical protein